jgi:hypothetical protein
VKNFNEHQKHRSKLDPAAEEKPPSSSRKSTNKGTSRKSRHTARHFSAPKPSQHK